MNRLRAWLVAALTLIAPPTSFAYELLAQISGGATTTKYPAVGAVLRGFDRHRLCTGTLIGCRAVLTAAHCVHSNPDPDRYKVYFQHAGIFAVDSIAIHEDFDEHAPSRNDIALVRLREPVTGIRPDVPLGRAQLTRLKQATATPTAPHFPFGVPGLIVGYGHASASDRARGIKRAGCIVTDDCILEDMAETHVCWKPQGQCRMPLAGGATTAANTCGGDSGGPLFVDVGDATFIAGITSGGVLHDCAAAGDKPFDTSVARFADWLRDKLGTELTAERCGRLGTVGSSTVAVEGDEVALRRGQAETSAGSIRVAAGTRLLRIGINGSDDGTERFAYAIEPPADAPAPPCQIAPGGRDRHRQFAFCEIESPAPGAWSVRVRQTAGDADGLVQVTFTAFR